MASRSTSWDTTRWVLIAVLVLGVLYILWQIRYILLLTLLSVILVVMLTIPVRFLVRRGTPRGPAIGISLVGIILIVTLLTIVALPTLVEQFTVLATRNIPEGVNRLVTAWQSGELQAQYPFLENIGPLLNDYLTPERLNELLGQIAQLASQVGGSALDIGGQVVSGVLSLLLSMLIMFFLTGYLLADPDTYSEGMVKLFPLWYRHRARAILVRIELMLRKWLEATLLSMVFVGVATWIGLALVGLEQAAALGVLAGVFSFIPNFGPILALVPSIVVALVQAPQSILWIILIIYGTSFLQSQVVSPLLVAESLKLPPAAVLVGQIIALLFFGFMGALLAVPLIAMVQVLIEEVYVRDVLGDVPEQEQIPETLQAQEALMPDGL